MINQNLFGGYRATRSGVNHCFGQDTLFVGVILILKPT